MADYVRRLMGRPTFRVDHAILLRDFWDQNYFHLLHDILPRLVMAEAVGLDPTIPIVVSENLMKCHGERLAGTPFLKSREVIVQLAGHTLCCKELFLLLPGEFARHWTPGVVDRIAAEPDVGDSRYIYCRREVEASEGRLVENSLEVEEIFRSAGFAVVGAATMTLNRQKAIFDRAEIIAGSQWGGVCKRAVSVRQAARGRRADFSKLVVNNVPDDGEGLRLHLCRSCDPARRG